MIPKEWFAEKEACVYTSLSRRTLCEARQNRRITYHMFGSKIVYSKNDLDKFMQRNTTLIKSFEDTLKKK